MSTTPESLGDGRYAVAGVLGEGAQGATFDAVDKREGRLVAIKRFQVKGARSWKDVELAEREAEVLQRLSHRLLPGYIDHFEEDGALYLVMERIDGLPLPRVKTFSQAEVLRFLHDAAEVLGYLHGRVPPVIHRDIKPGNVLRRPTDGGDAEYVLVDFGSVRNKLRPGGGSTVTGTFGYMAPEQLQGRALPATDVYSVGATALWMLSGVEPESLPHKGLAVDVRATLAGVAKEPWIIALERMLEPDPEKRATSLIPLLSTLGARPGGFIPDDRPSSPADRASHPEDDPEVRAAARAERDSRRRRRRDRVAHARQRAEALVERLPSILVVVVIVLLMIARLGITLGLRVGVPVVLAILSVIFGKRLLRAGRASRAMAGDLDEQLRGAQDALRGSRVAPPSKRAQGVRIEVDEGEADTDKQRVRIAEDAVEQAFVEVGRELEDTVDEVEQELRRPLPRREDP